MKARAKAIEALRQNNYIFKRHGANHDIYFNEETRMIIPLKRHDFDERDLRYILKEIKYSKYED